MELNAFRAVFGERPPPVYGVKGALGHTLGAAGAIETALALRALAAGVVPAHGGPRGSRPGGAAGWCRPEPAPLRGAAAAAHQLRLRRRQRGAGLWKAAGMKALVTGIGWVTAAGMGTGRGKRLRVPPAGDLPRRPRAATSSPSPTSGSAGSTRSRRLALAAVALALRDAGLAMGTGSGRGGDGRRGTPRLPAHRPGLPGDPRPGARARQPASSSPTRCRTSFSARPPSASA